MAEHNFQVAVGDRSTPLSVRCYDEGKDNNLTGLTVLFAMDEGTSTTNKLAETSTGVTVQPGKTFTADTTNKRYGCNGHGFQNGWEVLVSTATTLPAPLVATTRYFIADATPNHFKLVTEPGGAVIDPTTAGTGTHTIKVIGQVQYAWTAADVATAGTFKGWFIIQDSGSLDRTFPNTEEGIGISIVTAN